jgi:predicted Zn-ribbon and HTH transcriptional regulator
MPVKKKALVVEETESAEPTLEQQAIAAFEGELKADAAAEEQAEELEAKKSPNLYIIKSTQIDKYSVKRERVKITPAVCDKCGFDVSIRNGLGDYESMSEAMRDQVKNAIAEHKTLVHTAAQDLIVSEDELPTEWLGQHKKF